MDVKHVKLIVKGMHCKSCDMLVKDSVSELNGVISVKSDFKKGSVDVDFEEKSITLKKIKDTIKDEGYEVE